MSWLLGTDNTSFWSDLTALPHNALYGTLSESQKADVIQAGQSQIQGVVDNLQQHYADLIPQDTISQDQLFADQQKKAVVTDVQKLTQGKCGDNLDLSGVGLGCKSISDLIKYGAIIALALVALYAVAVFGAFIPKRG